MNTLLNGIEGELLKAIYGVVGLILAFLIKEVQSYVKNKRQSEAVKLGAETYNYRVTVAKQIFLQGEQLFKLIPNSGSLKATMFDKLLLAKFPTLSQEQIDHFREAAVGFFNGQVETILAPVLNVNDESDVKIESEDVEKVEPAAAI